MQSKLHQKAMMDAVPPSPSMQGANVNEHHGVVLFSGFGLNGLLPLCNRSQIRDSKYVNDWEGVRKGWLMDWEHLTTPHMRVCYFCCLFLTFHAHTHIYQCASYVYWGIAIIIKNFVIASLHHWTFARLDNKEHCSLSMFLHPNFSYVCEFADIVKTCMYVMYDIWKFHSIQ